jgi:hypothetical protein
MYVIAKRLKCLLNIYFYPFFLKFLARGVARVGTLIIWQGPCPAIGPALDTPLAAADDKSKFDEI